MAADRTVRHLRLAAPSRAQAQQLLPRLEDALRCASLPDDGVRLLVLRRLALGTVPADISGPALARLIEQRVADGPAGGWVVADAPAADSAGGVVFASALAARTRLALQLLQGAPCRAWYWPLAVPEFQPALGRGDNLRRLAWAVATLPEARSALPAWVAPLLQAGHGPALAALLAPREGEALLRQAGWHLPDGVAGAAHTAAAPAAPASPGPGAQARPGPGHTAQAALPPWLQRLARAAGRPAGPTVAAQAAAGAPAGQLADDAPRPRTLPTAEADGGGRGAGPGARPGGSDAGWSTHPAKAGSAGRPPGAVDRWPASPGGDGPASRGVLAPPAVGPRAAEARPGAGLHPPPAQAAERWPAVPSPLPSPAAGAPLAAWPAGAPTAAGGLLCLLPLLQHLGWPAWLAASGADGPAATAALLGRALQRLQVPPDDPAWALAWAGGGAVASADTAMPAPGPAVATAPPATWGDRRWALAACGRHGHPTDTLADRLAAAPDAPAQAALWLLACRRWLRRAGGLGLASLVRRPGRLALTATHADGHFRLADTDLRVRRLGLDLDPGWLPWFGRVVAFHYAARDWP